MHKTKHYKIDGCDDVELKIKRESKLEFNLDWDDEKPMRALLVFINGIRNADYAGYEAHLAEFAVREFGVAVLRVEYHCIGSRPQVGAKIYMDKKDKEIFINLCEQISNFCKVKMNLSDSLTDSNELSLDESALTINSLNDAISVLKNQRKLPFDFHPSVQMSMKSSKNEYQNFGLMQGLDILNAICFVKENAEFSFEKDSKTLLFGTSHGGYIALLAAKFAPWLIDAVVENCAYLQPQFYLTGFESKPETKKFCEAMENRGNFRINYCIDTHFNNDKNSPHFYSPARAKIRNILESQHLELLAKCRKVSYISYHCAFDKVALPKFKAQLYQSLENLGFDATLHMIKDESEIDGRFIKNLEHGMGMSMKELISRHLPPLLKAKIPAANSAQITYPCENLLYHFTPARGGGGLSF